MGEAFLHAAVPTTAISGIRKCGIFPFNPEVFVDADLLAAEKRKQNRKRGKKAIITDSPYKNELEEETKKRQEEESKKRKRSDMKKQTQKTKKSIQIKKQLNFDVEEEAVVEEDCLCFYCKESFSRSKDNEGWIMCSLCKQ
ncbi:hypothetical protein J6590_074468 [Homalodisca vitripennis]|nr:hypothetical protein J6590_074468 [Homalodisca vitripennis]